MISVLKNPGTIKGIAQVNDKIWITDQTNDKIYIYNTDGTLSSSITTGLDNMRGINVVNNEVWIANDGSNNGATSDSIIRYTLSGTFIGFYAAPNTSIFDMVDNNNGIVYVSGLDTNGIQRMNYSGAIQTNLVAPGVFKNMQQINLNSDGNLAVAVFQNETTSGKNAGIYVISITDGSTLNYWPVEPGRLRGVIQTGNGNYLYSTENGITTINTVTGVQTLVLAGTFQYFTKFNTATMSVSDVVKNKINIYPNPTSDILKIDSNINIENIQINSADGKLVKQKDVKSTKSVEINVSSLVSGIYYVTINNDKGNSYKFIKK